jgi:2-polyprenyl-3-methyl-5-hydroxy-6-metoxy-1,4-benzoquinol methylase
MQQIRGVRQRLHHYLRRLKQENDTEKRLARELQQERTRRLRAESKLKQQGNGAPPTGSSTARERAHALPEPDTSVNKLQLFRALLTPLKPGKMLDLGSGRGNFSLAAARLGWQVTAVDARTVRWPDSGEDPEQAKLIRSVRWVQADVRDFPIRGGEYDLVCILGLLHHLEVDDQVKLLKRCSDTLTLLDTRIAPRIADVEGPYEGVYIREHGETREERDQVPTASWGNEVSFRHTEESLLRLVQACGYSKMLSMKPPHRRNYTMFLLLPPPES